MHVGIDVIDFYQRNATKRRAMSRNAALRTVETIETGA
jgi:hypothetical protein